MKYCIVWVFLISSCLERGNLFKKHTDSLSLEKKAIKNIESNNFEDALDNILSLIEPSIKTKILDVNIDPKEKADILYKALNPLKNGEALISLYSNAVLGKNGIDLFDLSVSALKKGEKTANPSESFIGIFTSGIPKNKSYTNSLKVVLLLSEYKENKSKNKSVLVNEILINFIAFAAHIMALDRSNDGRIIESELLSITAQESASIYSLLDLAYEKIRFVIEKDNNNLYKTMQAKIFNIKKAISEEQGANKEEKLKKYLLRLNEVYDFSGENLNSIQDAQAKIIFIRDVDKIVKMPLHKDLDSQSLLYLQKVRSFYLSKIVKDPQGWLRDTKCDGLLFNSLASMSGVDIPLMKARDDQKRWFRHASRDCFQTGGSRSSISRDMFIGLLLWIYSKRDLSVIKDLIEYGENHKNEKGLWIMGEGDPFAIQVNERLQKTFYLLRDYLEKKTLPSETGHSWFFHHGYEGHLEVLHMLLRISIRGGFYEKEKELLKEYAEENPGNALFHFVYHLVSDGNFSNVMNMLKSPYFPSNQMPSTAQRCSFYLWERRQFDDVGGTNPDWQPCPQDKKDFSGLDFLFVLHLLEKKNLF